MTDAELVGAVVFLATLTQRLSGIGFGLVAAPCLVLLLGPSNGIRMTLVLATVVSGCLTWEWRQEFRKLPFWLLLAPAVLTLPLWRILLSRLSPDLAARTAGLGVCLGVAALILGIRCLPLAGRCGAILAGSVSSGMNLLGGIGGPPVALYAVNAGWTRLQSAAVMNAFFVGVNVVAIPVLGLPKVSSQVMLLGLGGMIVGILVSRWLHRLVSEPLARLFTFTVAMTSGLILLVAGA